MASASIGVAITGIGLTVRFILDRKKRKADEVDTQILQALISGPQTADMLCEQLRSRFRAEDIKGGVIRLKIADRIYESAGGYLFAGKSPKISRLGV